MKILGKTLDIHGGGLDLQFPHHENELAQSESYTGKPFARYWMHNGLLKMGKAKMAGSVGNVVNVVDLLKKYHPETVRFLLLSTHYRSPIEYSEERLQEVKRSLEASIASSSATSGSPAASFYRIDGPDAAAASSAARAAVPSGSRRLCASASWSTWTTTSTPAARSASCTNC